MAVSQKALFADTEAGLLIRAKLEAMFADSTYTTESGYHVNIDLHPENKIGFVDKHMDYLNTHKGVNPDYYLSNLRLMTRRR